MEGLIDRSTREADRIRRDYLREVPSAREVLMLPGYFRFRLTDPADIADAVAVGTRMGYVCRVYRGGHEGHLVTGRASPARQKRG